MKEILYIQAGELSNYTGTHFWNTQESYLNLNESPDYAGIDTGVAFCENVDDKGRPTLCPRLIIIDKKSNFGTLARCNALGDMEEVPEELTESLWNGGIVEYRQDLIPKSTYQSHMEKDTGSNLSEEAPYDSSTQRFQDPGDIRYWSDFNRVYCLPRSLQKMPDPPEWESSDPGWIQGQEMFTRHNEDAELMDGSVRLFIEDCESMQGFQIMNDVDAFGSFMNSFVIALRDEYPKMTSVVFPLMSTGTLDIHNAQNTRQLFNEAMYLRTLNECSSMNIPIKHPARWDKSLWNEPLNFLEHSRYHQSAILSTHLETSTLPLRLKNRHEDIASLCGMLNWRGSTPFGELYGAFPLKSVTDMESNTIVNFSSDIPIKLIHPYSRFDVTRGFSTNTRQVFDSWSSKVSSLSASYVKRVHGPPYPLPDSFPPIPGNSKGVTPWEIRPGVANTLNNLPTVEAYTSISTSSATSELFKSYALFTDKCIKRRTSAVASIDVSLDDLKDLANDLWTIHDNFSGDGQSLEM
ncbi:tubulin nucleotide-binding domain-like protein [Phlegmacium glaucopus]|nr:tubulin nucleotide-binding domain-like protein [Phlegmacium glaucopus]